MEKNVSIYAIVNGDKYEVTWLWFKEDNDVEHLIRISTISYVSKDGQSLAITSNGETETYYMAEEDINSIIQGIARGGYK